MILDNATREIEMVLILIGTLGGHRYWKAESQLEDGKF